MVNGSPRWDPDVGIRLLAVLDAQQTPNPIRILGHEPAPLLVGFHCMPLVFNLREIVGNNSL